MLKVIIATLTLSIYLSTASKAAAEVFGGSNLDFSGYPKHRCTKPFRPYEFTSNFEVENYNEQMRLYFTCIKSYLSNADYDIERIKQATDDAIREAKSLR